METINKFDTVDFKICTSCLLCGEPVPMMCLDDRGTKICDDCKQLWKKLKDKRSDNNAE